MEAGAESAGPQTLDIKTLIGFGGRIHFVFLMELIRL